jgi:hypothetical protein
MGYPALMVSIPMAAKMVTGTLALGAVSTAATTAAGTGMKMATGGTIPAGYPNDSFPAMLTSGEVVIPREKVKDPTYIAEVLDVPGFQKGLGELDPTKKSTNNLWKGWGIGYMEMLKKYEDIPARYREDIMKLYGLEGPRQPRPNIEGGSLSEIVVTAQSTADKNDKYINDPMMRKFYGDKTYNQYTNEYNRLLEKKYEGKEITDRERDLAWHGATGLVNQRNKPFGEKAKDTAIDLALSMGPDILLGSAILPNVMKGASRLIKNMGKVFPKTPEVPYIPGRSLSKSAFYSDGFLGNSFEPAGTPMDSYTRRLAEHPFVSPAYSILPREERMVRETVFSPGSESWRGDVPGMSYVDFANRYGRDLTEHGEELMGSVIQNSARENLEGRELVKEYYNRFQHGWWNPEENGMSRANPYLSLDEFTGRYGSRFKRGTTEKAHRLYLRDEWFPQSDVFPITPERIRAYAQNPSTAYPLATIGNLQIRELGGRNLTTVGGDLSSASTSEDVMDFFTEASKEYNYRLRFLARHTRSQAQQLDWQRGLDVNPTAEQTVFRNAPFNEQEVAFLRNMAKPRPSGTQQMMGGLRNRSRFTKEQLESHLSKEEFGKIAGMGEQEFANTVLSPTGKVHRYGEGLGRLKLGINPESPDSEIIEGATPISIQEYVDKFNAYLDILNNEIIPKHNKSGIAYRAKELTPRGYLHWESETSPDVTWGVRSNPGEWQGEVQNIISEDYYRAIPGIEINNSSRSVFGDTPRRGSGTYKSLNEYLKSIDLGRVKSGFNSQTPYSEGLWEKAIKEGEAVGHYNTPGTIYAIMKSMLPIPAFGSLYGLDKKFEEAPKLATGGVVPNGYPNDTYPAWLTSGEAVVPFNVFAKMKASLENKYAADPIVQAMTKAQQAWDMYMGARGAYTQTMEEVNQPIDINPSQYFKVIDLKEDGTAGLRHGAIVYKDILADLSKAAAIENVPLVEALTTAMRESGIGHNVLERGATEYQPGEIMQGWSANTMKGMPQDWDQYRMQNNLVDPKYIEKKSTGWFVAEPEDTAYASIYKYATKYADYLRSFKIDPTLLEPFRKEMMFLKDNLGQNYNPFEKEREERLAKDREVVLKNLGMYNFADSVYRANKPRVAGLLGGGEVPPGYNNDTYPTMLTSGEIVMPDTTAFDDLTKSIGSLIKTIDVLGGQLDASLAPMQTTAKTPLAQAGWGGWWTSDWESKGKQSQPTTTTGAADTSGIMSPEQIAARQKAIEEYYKTMGNTSGVNKGLGTISSGFATLSQLTEGNAQGWLNYAATATGSITGLISSITAVTQAQSGQAISGAVAGANTIPFPLNLLAIAASVAATIAALASVPKMKEGGLIPPGYNNDSFHAMLSSGEAVIPLDKMGDTFGETDNMVEFHIKGDDLVGIHDKRRKAKSKI